MSKTTKIIAALGVVAGLGVAALPAFTYAEQSVTGDAVLFVEVEPAIAMTITGNNDDGDEEAFTSYKYTIVTPEESDSPASEGWYEKSGNTYTVSEDDTVVEGKTYFARSNNTEGVDVFAPTSNGNGNVAGHAEAFKVGPSSSYAALLPNSTTTLTSTVTVYTNNAGGYTLTVKDADSDTSLRKDQNNAIAAHATPTAGEARWSIEGGSLSASAITAAGLQVKQTDAKTTGGDATTMTYTVSTSADQATGVYTDTITYTATTN